MAQLSNVPAAETILRVEARKAFPLGLHLYDTSGGVVDLTGCELTIVAKAEPIAGHTILGSVSAVTGIRLRK